MAYFFNWLVTPLDALLHVVRADFAGVYAKANLRATDDAGMVLDTGSGLKFHSAFNRELGETLEGPRFDALYAESAAKYSMLAERFRTLARSSNRVLYVIKTPHEAARTRTLELRDVLTARYPAHDFDILLLQTADREEADWGEAQLRNRYLARFTHPSRAADGDVASWDRVFAEFPLLPRAMAAPAAPPAVRPAA